MNLDVLSEYEYEVPEDLISTKPADPRDQARLFVYNTATGEITFDIFRNLPQYLDANDTLVFNETRVVPARIVLMREADEICTLLLLNERQDGEEAVKAIVNKHIRIGEELTYKGKKLFEVVGQDENVFTLRMFVSEADMQEILEAAGETPIPGYLKDVELSEGVLRERYQTVFAKNGASVAAPTASLHFTEGLLQELGKTNVDMQYVSLHVGLGTFMTVYPEQLEKGVLHEEPYSMSAETAKELKEGKLAGKKIVAVGTTVARTLESSKDVILSDSLKGIEARTNIFIKPPYQFEMVDSMITNFHVPRSSLMCMIDAFLQQKNAQHSLVELYEIATAEKFRFFSFGDSMLIR